MFQSTIDIRSKSIILFHTLCGHKITKGLFAMPWIDSFTVWQNDAFQNRYHKLKNKNKKKYSNQQNDGLEK